MKSDFTFANDDAHRFMPWHVGIMVALACLLLSLMLSLGQWAGGQKNGYENTLTLIVPGSLEHVDDKVEAVRKTLLNNPAVSKVTAVKEAELRAMLVPWIGKGDALSDVAVPIVLDVELHKKLDVDALQKTLSALAPGIEIDSHQHWVDTFATFTRIMQVLSGGLALVVLGAMAFIIMFSARASLHLHSRNVQLLHSIGAEDSYIAKQFQNEHFWLGLRGALPGAVIAMLAFWLLGMSVSHLDAPLLPNFHLTWAHIGLLVLMPIFSALIALCSTRFSVLRELRQVL